MYCFIRLLVYSSMHHFTKATLDVMFFISFGVLFIHLCVICSTCLSMLPVIQISMYCFMYLIIWIYVARLLPKLHTTKRKQGITKTIIFSFAEKRYFFEWVVYSREATAERPYLLTSLLTYLPISFFHFTLFCCCSLSHQIRLHKQTLPG